jgi:hypothetical protein
VLHGLCVTLSIDDSLHQARLVPDLRVKGKRPGKESREALCDALLAERICRVVPGMTLTPDPSPKGEGRMASAL